MRFRGQRAVLALAGLRIDRQHARAEDQAARADRRGLVVPVVLAKIEARQGRGDDFTHGVLSLHDCANCSAAAFGRQRSTRASTALVTAVSASMISIIRKTIASAPVIL